MPITGPDILLYEQKDGIVTITFNRPERLNALNMEMREKIHNAFERFRDDDDARVAILCGAGKSFCSGMDLKDVASGVASDEAMRKARQKFPDKVNIWKPMIAAIQGYALGGGWAMAMLCDVRIAAEDAELGISEVVWNMPAAWVCDLTRQLHLGHALEIVLWGDKRITAQRAYEMGWINKVVPEEKLMDEAMSWAERILYLGPRALRTLKEILYRGFYLTPEQAYAWGCALQEGLVDSEDTQEAARAFREKRKPQFTG